MGGRSAPRRWKTKLGFGDDQLTTLRAPFVVSGGLTETGDSTLPNQDLRIHIPTGALRIGLTCWVVSTAGHPPDIGPNG